MVRSRVHFHKLHSADGKLVIDSSNHIPGKGVILLTMSVRVLGNVALVSQRRRESLCCTRALRAQEIHEPMTPGTATLESTPRRRDTAGSREDRKIVKRSKMAMKKNVKRSRENNNTQREKTQVTRCIDNCNS